MIEAGRTHATADDDEERPMATVDEAKQAIIDAIASEAARNGADSGRRILAYSEAWAWLTFPAQHHGGSNS